MPVDLDLDLGVETAGDRVCATRVDDAPVPRAGTRDEVVQPLVQLAQGGRGEIDDLDGGVLALGNRHQTKAFSHA